LARTLFAVFDSQDFDDANRTRRNGTNKPVERAQAEVNRWMGQESIHVNRFWVGDGCRAESASYQPGDWVRLRFVVMPAITPAAMMAPTAFATRSHPVFS